MTPTKYLGVLKSPLFPAMYDDTDAGWAFVGNWRTTTVSGPYNDTLHYSDVLGDSAQFSFYGTQFILYYSEFVSPGRGTLDVYVDNVKIDTVDESGPGQWQKTWTSPTLTNVLHTVKLVVAQNIVVDIDAIYTTRPA